MTIKIKKKRMLIKENKKNKKAEKNDLPQLSELFQESYNQKKKN